MGEAAVAWQIHRHAMQAPNPRLTCVSDAWRRDYAAMRQVLARRYAYRQRGQAVRPILIDGGRGQLNAARGVADLA
jgi:excinuclease UvrABC nuclease subunit